jgi:hypothetical protein
MTPEQSPFAIPAAECLPFDDAVREAVSLAQSASTALLEALPSYPRTSQELAKQLDVDKNLAWKVLRLVQERDGLAAGRFVLGTQALGILMRAAAAQGVPSGVIDRLREAGAAFERVVRTHAGDRQSMDMMLSGAGDTPDESTEMGLRRAAFRSMSYFAGVQARTQLQAFVIGPSASEGRVDGVSLRALVDLRRVRAGAPVVVGRSVCTDDGGVVLPPGGLETLDDGVRPGEMPLISGFCSKPLPRFRRVMGERGFLEDVLDEGPVGNTAAITVTSGEVLRSLAPRSQAPGHERAELVTRVRTPVETLVADLLVHKDLYGPLEVGVDVYCDLAGEAMRRVAERQKYRRAVTERVERLGRGVDAAHTPDVPRYTALLRHVLGRLGWEAGSFDAYRLRMEFPFVPGSVVMVHGVG